MVSEPELTRLVHGWLVHGWLVHGWLVVERSEPPVVSLGVQSTWLDNDSIGETTTSRARNAIKAPVSSKALKYLLEEASEWIPKISRKRSKKSERLFWQSGGGFDRNVIKPGTLMNMMDYIHMNQNRAGS